MFNFNGAEFLLLVLLALIVLGPQRLPEYAQKLAQAVRQLRDLAEGARSQIKDEMGPAFEDVDWRQLDPRQYDPRRIVREALSTPEVEDSPKKLRGTPTPVTQPPADDTPVTGRRRPMAAYDPTRPTPYDAEAT